MRQIGKSNFAHTLRWLACAVLVAAAIVFTHAPGAGVCAQQNKDKKQAQQKQDPKKQDPQKKPDEVETIKIGTQLVNVLFSVQDKQNRYINDIKQEDIEILANDIIIVPNSRAKSIGGAMLKAFGLTTVTRVPML